MNPAHHGLPRPWSHRAFDHSPVSFFWSGFILAVGFILVFLLMELVLGRFVEFQIEAYREDLRLGVIFCLSAAYMSVASIYVVQNAQRTADELAPVAERAGRITGLEEAGYDDRLKLRTAGFVGVGLLLVATVLVKLDFSDLAALGQMSPEAYFHRVMLIWIGWFGGRVVHVSWSESTRFSEIGRERIEIDLLDLSAVAPLSRFGLRQALITIAFFALIVPMFYDSAAAPNLFWILLVVAFSTLLLAAAGLLIPVRGVHHAIVRQKVRELNRSNAEIRLALTAQESRSPSGLTGWALSRLRWAGRHRSRRLWTASSHCHPEASVYFGRRS